MCNYHVGQVFNGSTIKYVYHYGINNDSSYCVYLEKETERITYQCTEEYTEKYYEIIAGLSKLEDFILNDSNKIYKEDRNGDNSIYRKQDAIYDKKYRKYAQRIASIYELAFNDKVDEAKDRLEDLYKYALKEKEQQCKNRYAIYYLLMNVIAIVVYCSFMSLKNDSISTDFIYLLTTIVLSITGGYVFLFFNLQKIKIDVSDSERTYRINALLRVFLSASAGLIVFLVAKAEIINLEYFTFSNKWGVYFVSILSGASQRFIPNLLSYFDGQINKKDNNENDKNLIV